MVGDAIVTLGAYLLGIFVLALFFTLIGSFVEMTWWTPLASVDGRAMVAWLAIAPGIITFFHRRWG